ncbi:hypothetical protein F5884DRAFT_117463 [Xylogone sp. PMI_703]|nr:hypothetical protein F5884DRAFT_117463 [Xylogone sp. PMI_703]
MNYLTFGVLLSAIPVFGGATTPANLALRDDCPAGHPGNWFSMAVYPQNDTSWFDMEYYSQVQMPFVNSLWAPFGMKGYTITQLNASAPFSTATLLYFDNVEQIQAAFDDSAEEINKRVKNFSNRLPTHWIGEVLYTVVN